MSNDEFFSLVCAYLNVPVTPWRLAMFAAWARYESDGRLLRLALNPLATTQDLKPPVAVGNWNSVGVKIFSNANHGAQATAETITNGFYPAIVNMINTQSLSIGDSALRDNFRTWVGSDAYGAALISEISKISASKEPVVVEKQFTLDDIIKVLGKAKLEEWLRDGDELLTGYEIEQIEQNKLESKILELEENIKRLMSLDEFLRNYK